MSKEVDNKKVYSKLAHRVLSYEQLVCLDAPADIINEAIDLIYAEIKGIKSFSADMLRKEIEVQLISGFEALSAFSCITCLHAGCGKDTFFERNADIQCGDFEFAEEFVGYELELGADKHAYLHSLQRKYGIDVTLIIKKVTELRKAFKAAKRQRENQKFNLESLFDKSNNT